MSPAQVKDVVRNLKVTYRGDNYHMLEQSSFVIELMYSNCNHFSNDLCKIIAGKEIPSYVNRCAKVASWFSGIVNAVADHMAVVTPSGGMCKRRLQKSSYRVQKVEMILHFQGVILDKMESISHTSLTIFELTQKDDLLIQQESGPILFSTNT